MTARLTIAVDAMGGDKAPDIVIDGLKIVRVRYPQVHFLVVGDKEKLEPLLSRDPELGKVCSILHTAEAISNDAKPSQAIRNGRRSSMWLAIDAVAQGKADGVVSAGNTGALMAISKFLLRMLPGIDRPAIAAFFPTMRSECVMLDLGANVDCNANNLVEFAVMGDLFSRTVLGVRKPTIGLLNVGAEDLKGNDTVKAAAAILRETKLPISFYGFVEGDDIGAGTVDVVVTDGFTGNIALKTVEGTVKLYNRFLKDAFTSSLLAKIGYLLARPALSKVKSRTDPRRYNGAMMLGLNGIAVKSHGGTDALGFANAVGVAVNLITQDFNEKIKQELDVLKNSDLSASSSQETQDK